MSFFIILLVMLTFLASIMTAGYNDPPNALKRKSK